MSALNDSRAGARDADPAKTSLNNADIVQQSEATCRAARDARDKRFATLRAKFAIAGFAMFVVSGDAGAEFVVSRWAWCKTFSDLDAAAAFAVQVGAA